MSETSASAAGAVPATDAAPAGAPVGGGIILASVGTRTPDITGVAKVTGAARFVSDVDLPRSLIGKVLHSPLAHARIANIDVSAAEALPGVEAVVTYHDSPPGRHTGTLLNLASYSGIEPWGINDRRVLDRRVRYVGDAVAAVAAVSELVAEQALELIEVEYEELPAVFDAATASAEGAPAIHDLVDRCGPDALPVEQAVERNLALTLGAPPEGDAGAALRDATNVSAGTGHTAKQKQAPLETFHSVAHFDAGGHLTLWAQTQQPFLLRRLLADVFRLPFSRITVRNDYLGGSFGAGLNVSREFIAVLLARKAGRPVKLVYSRQEEFIDRPTRCWLSPYSVTVAVDDEGNIGPIARKITSLAGAHVEAGGLQALIAAASGNPLYRRTSSKTEIEVVYTNTSPCGPMRGFGNPEDTFVREQVLDDAARSVGIDPVEFRLKNLAVVGDPGVFGPDFPITSTGMADCLRIGAGKIGWREKCGRKRDNGALRAGVGVGCMAHVSGAWPAHVEHSNAVIKLNEDGTAVLTAWPASMGTNCTTSLAQVVAEVLGLQVQDVRVIWGDTDSTPFEIGSHASRSMYVVGRAVELAARDAREKLLARAAALLEVEPGLLELSDGVIRAGDGSGKSASVAEVIRQFLYSRGEVAEIVGRASYSPTTSPPAYQAFFVDVEVDVETGEIHLRKAVLVNDSGVSINPMTVEGQLEGGTAQGLGYALWEDPALDAATGRSLADDFDTYKIASALDMPELEVVLLEQPEPTGPFGAKGAGEPGCVTQAAAVANALYDAVGVRVWSLPITPEKVLAALRTAEATADAAAIE